MKCTHTKLKNGMGSKTKKCAPITGKRTNPTLNKSYAKGGK